MTAHARLSELLKEDWRLSQLRLFNSLEVERIIAPLGEDAGYALIRRVRAELTQQGYTLQALDKLVFNEGRSWTNETLNPTTHD